MGGKMNKLLKYWLPPITWMIIIFAFSSRPTIAVSTIDWRDFFFKKTIHFFEFGILFFLYFRAIRNTIKISTFFKMSLLAFILAVLYGASDEFHQTFITGRTGTLRDAIIDASGAGVAWFGLWKLLPKAPKKLQTLAKSWQII